MGSRKIKKHLEQNSIKTASGKDVWSTSTIDRILCNEKYMGVLITQKPYVADFLNGKQVKNTGEIIQYIFENHHKAIIDKTTFEQVQQRKKQRSITQGPTPELIL